MKSIIEMANERKSYSVNIRRELHMYPELSFKEFETSKRIKKYLDEIGVSYRAVAQTGIIAEIKGNTPGKTVALRADMDALSVTETTDLEFKSKHEGIMHACGHDAQVAIDFLNKN